jgi:hypothetical protein
LNFLHASTSSGQYDHGGHIGSMLSVVNDLVLSHSL